MTEEKIIDLLSESFYDNLSVNFVIKQDENKLNRIKKLMRYSLYQSKKYGEVIVSEDHNACALIQFPDRKRTSIKSTFKDVDLAINCIGIKNLNKVLKREKLIKAYYPKENYIYVAFIGVAKSSQGKGIGSKLLLQLIELAKKENKQLILETSNPKNFPFYEKHGFTCFKKIELETYTIRIYLHRLG